MFTVGVAYGYGTREELAGADVVCDSAEELKELLKN
jgi:phosphoglycolate phosphatase-like HAD superfamily hydrolase